LLPHVQDTAWFFDTELLVLAERAGLRIAEVPVDWIDDLDSRVDIVQTAKDDLRGVARLARSLMTGRIPLADLRAELGRGAVGMPGVAPGLARQALRFAVIGGLSTLAYLLLFLLGRPAMGAQGANLFALLATAVANTAAHRRFTFGVRGGPAARHHLQGLIVFLLGLALTSGALAGLTAITSHPPRVVEVAVLVVANLAATVLRFVLFRRWVFARRTDRPSEESVA
ncbi:MAG: GtrA family protein, partial [Jatrophihabitans sp.]|uniref:GtrA family protein n=1 Tax=Jatrophihabitans sp. TaxID=1932789 RepID=UPI003F7E3FDA